MENRDLTPEGVDIFVAAERAQELERALHAAGAHGIDPEVFEVARVEAGIPKFLVDMDTSTIPLEAGIEDRAISFTKGCYVGQEVIIRVMHRGGGRVAKKLVSIRLDGPAAPHDRLRSGDRDVGELTSVVRSPKLGAHLALGYVHRDFVEPGTPLTVQAAAGDLPAVVSTPPSRSAIRREG